MFNAQKLVYKMSAKFDQVEDVDIESDGLFKYILVKIKDGNYEKYIVRGYERAAYHGTCKLCGG